MIKILLACNIFLVEKHLCVEFWGIAMHSIKANFWSGVCGRTVPAPPRSWWELGLQPSQAYWHNLDFTKWLACTVPESRLIIRKTNPHLTNTNKPTHVVHGLKDSFSNSTAFLGAESAPERRQQVSLPAASLPLGQNHYHYRDIQILGGRRISTHSPLTEPTMNKFCFAIVNSACVTILVSWLTSRCRCLQGVTRL